MDLNKYQRRVAEFDLFETAVDLKAPGFLEKVLGLVGEAGEAADKIKKIIRDKGGYASEEDRDAIVKELGDVLWYVASIARYLDVPLSNVAEGNIAKLESRKRRNKISGEGDER
ncbi:MAG: nucleoside triphosphate pyrophosphohydrolase family protein [Kiritimatiellae bacterium]|nr:nucleoside triphosphate pyrophosphohydrolase family protein [Kiritimatiellia bacterium]MBQ2660653.1 nucleoside triphosphate pyrophosphohydrolase family protein [Candidatus Saccharibacteria bacterium]